MIFLLLHLWFAPHSLAADCPLEYFMTRKVVESLGGNLLQNIPSEWRIAMFGTNFIGSKGTNYYRLPALHHFEQMPTATLSKAIREAILEAFAHGEPGKEFLKYQLSYDLKEWAARLEGLVDPDDLMRHSKSDQVPYGLPNGKDIWVRPAVRDLIVKYFGPLRPGNM